MPALAKFMAMPPPIVPAPTMPARLDLALRRVGRHVEHLGGLALGEEVVALRRRLRRGQQLHEQLALALHALVERQLDGGLHALDDVPRRLEAAGAAGDRLLGLLEQVGRFERRLEIAHAPARRVLGDQHLGMRHGAGQQVALDDGVDDALALGLGRRDVAARDDGVERVLGAGEARQALRAAGARQQAEMDLGQADARARQRRRDSARPAPSPGRRPAACRAARRRRSWGSSPWWR